MDFTLTWLAIVNGYDVYVTAMHWLNDNGRWIPQRIEATFLTNSGRKCPYVLFTTQSDELVAEAVKRLEKLAFDIVLSRCDWDLAPLPNSEQLAEMAKTIDAETAATIFGPPRAESSSQCPQCGSKRLAGLMASFWVEVNEFGDPKAQWSEFSSETEVGPERMCYDCNHEW